MTLAQLQSTLQSSNELCFLQTNGQALAAHFHLTELGIVTKRFVDCGGQYREERKATLQLWLANDIAHRLSPQKMNTIVQRSIEKLGLQPTDEVVVEHQGVHTIELFGLSAHVQGLQLQPLHTACLAQEACLPSPKLSADFQVTPAANACCGSGHC